MKYSLCADIMFVAVGENGPIWPVTEGIIEAMELAKANGLTGIEMFGLAGRDLDKLAQASKDLGIEIRACVSGGATLLGDPSKEAEMIEQFKATVPMAQKIGCRKIIFNCEEYAKDLPREEVLASMVESLKKMAPIAEAADVMIVVEPLTDGFFQSSKEAFGMIREVNSPNVKLLYDIFHFQNIEGNITNTIKANLDLIGDIHGAGSPMRFALTDGELNYRFILDTLVELGYEGNFCLEFFTFPGRDAMVKASCELLPM